VYPVGPPIFEPLTASILGNSATPTDGFDTMAAPVYAALGSDQGAGPNLDADWVTAYFPPGQVKASSIDPLQFDISDLVGSGQNALGPVDTDALILPQPPLQPSNPNIPSGPVDPCANVPYGPEKGACEAAVAGRHP
jgi:hypothetical protein